MSQFIRASNMYISSWNSPERKLFVAVLSQAVHDAFSNHVPSVEKRQARAWLMGNGRDFRDICEFAGRDAQYVFEKVKEKGIQIEGWNID